MSRRKEFEALAARKHRAEVEPEDEFGDGTVAGSSSLPKFKADVDMPIEKGRLKMRAAPDMPERFKGKVVSRKDMQDESASGSEESLDADASEDAEGSDAEDSDEEGCEQSDLGDSDQEESDQEEPEIDALGGDSSDDDMLGAADRPKLDADLEAEFAIVEERNRSSRNMSTADRTDIAPGVRQQIDVWQKVSEFRMAAEAPIQVANRLPAKRKLLEVAGGSAEITACQKAVRGLLGTLICLQEELGRVELPPRKKPKTSERSVWKSMMGPQNDAVKSWAVRLADEWKEQTRIEVQRPQFKVLDQTIAQQINFAEQKRTPAKVHPSGSAEVGASASTELNLEVYDDKEFYIQGLKDIVSKTNSSGIYSELKQVASEQANRKKSVKGNKDRRASKGRKIRYVSIDKLVNFMAPQKKALVAGFDDLSDTSFEVTSLMNSIFKADV